jgi:hypothetical protein
MAPRVLTRAIGAWPSWTFWLAATAIAGGGACFLPLFETFGYELSLAAALVASLGAGNVAATIGPRLRAGRWALGGAVSSVPRLYGRALGAGLALLLLPVLLSLLNGLRVPPCNLREGAAFFALDSIFAIAAAAAAGLFLGLALRTARAAIAAWYAVWLAGVIAAGAAFYATPAVFLYGPFFGYFPGVLYDTLVEVRAPLVTYRAVTAVDVCALLAIAAAAFDPASQRLSLTKVRARPGAVALAIVLAIGATALHAGGAQLGHFARRADLERALPMRLTRGRLDLFFPSGARPREAVELADDAAFSLSRVEEFFGARAEGRIAVFFFESAKEKGRIMGASRTNVAKPWRAEVYVVMDDVPHEVLRHELAHAVAASFGRGPFRVAGDAGGLLPNPGLIEGVASAAEGPRGDLTLHQWAAAMKRLGMLPPLRRAMGLGFFGFNASSVYTAAGSFVAWLRARRGAGAIRALYGGAAFEKAAGAPLSALEKEWRAYLGTVPLEEADLGAARLRFDRPSVIGTTCVHEVARLEDEADERADAGDFEGALALLQEARVRSGDSTDARFALLKALAALGDERAVREMAAAFEASSELSGARRAQIAEVLADLDAQGGRLDRAAAAYEAIIPRAASDDVRRRIEVKARLCGTGQGADPAILGALAATRPARGAKDGLAALRIGELAARGADPWLDYLAARQHFRYGDRRGALAWLDAARGHGLDATAREIRIAAGLLRGAALYHLGRVKEARAVFAALAASREVREGDRALAADWIARCDYASRQRTGS